MAATTFPRATITGTTMANDAVYFNITVKRGGASWKVARRYSEFDSLRRQLEKDGIDVVDFPRKHVFQSYTDVERNIKLSIFMESYVLCNDQNPECRDFLDLNRIWWVVVPASAAPAPEHTVTLNASDDNGNGQPLTFTICVSLAVSPLYVYLF